ncbi:hypothetical protein RND81_13G193400 [Saponaria officinalis]|uniref:Uncharacterized protein n=1 Tax=Saponaria officinalis TaxID=3572 RepID=A0AAW1H1R4_SAPOF
MVTRAHWNICSETSGTLLKERNFKQALDIFNLWKLDLTCPSLSNLYKLCLEGLEEEEQVKKCIEKVRRLAKKKKYEKALKVINASGFSLKQRQEYCLKKLGRNMDTPSDITLDEEEKVIPKSEEATTMRENTSEEIIDGEDENVGRNYNRGETIDEEEKVIPKSEDATTMRQKMSEETIIEVEDENKEKMSEGETGKEASTMRENTGEKEITMMVNLSYTIEKYLGTNLHEGKISCNFFDIPKSFIDLTSLQTNNIKTLMRLGRENKFFVSIDHKIEHSSFPLWVVEPVVPVEYFFKLELKLFQQDKCHESSKANWWKRIENSFNQIFRDVVHALIYMDFLGYTCGNLKDSIYVSRGEGVRSGQGKILPSFDNKKKQKFDVVDLIEKMRAVIRLPFKY